MTNAYSPALRRLIDNKETCPPELLLFFHHIGWNQTIQWPSADTSQDTSQNTSQDTSQDGDATEGTGRVGRVGRVGVEAATAGNNTSTLIQYLEQGHAAALVAVADLQGDWESLKDAMGRSGDQDRFEGVRSHCNWFIYGLINRFDSGVYMFSLGFIKFN